LYTAITSTAATVDSAKLRRGRGRRGNTWKVDLEQEMWTAGFKYSWKSTELDRVEWSADSASTRHKSC